MICIKLPKFHPIIKIKAIKAMNTNATGNNRKFSTLNPNKKEIPKTINPCKIATVAPPKVRPSIICHRGTGATKVSFRKPNCLSQITLIPEKIAKNKILIETIPGTKNCM